MSARSRRESASASCSPRRSAADEPRVDEWLVLLCVLATVRWWWPVGSGLLADLRAASEPPVRGPATSTTGFPGMGVHPAPRRALAFRPAPPPRAVRRRWEAGFGRRAP
jgi:hypothetical protein